MKLAIILTNDWELFVNGQGDYYRNQKEPLITLLKIIHSYKAKLTIFPEVIQQLNAIDRANSDDGYRAISEDWENIVRELVQQGHDVQLHLHPQILGGELNYDKKSIANIRKPEMLDIIQNCKSYLEHTIRSVSQDYSCKVFRAGGYAMQPSDVVIENLVKAGIKCDSTVTKGLVDPYYNFKNAYSHYFPWLSKWDICQKQEVDDSILELPIYSIPKLDSPVLRVLFPRIYYLLFHSFILSKDYKEHFELNKKGNSDYSLKSKYSAESKKSMFKFIVSKLIQPHAIQFDYDKYPARLLVRYIKKKWNKICSYIPKDPEQFKDCYIPIVLIGHTKQLHETYNIEQLLSQLEIELAGNFEFLTMSDYFNNFMSNSSLYSKLDLALRSHKLL